MAESIESVGISYTWEPPLASVDPWNVNASLDPGPETGRTVIEGIGRPAD